MSRKPKMGIESTKAQSRSSLEDAFNAMFEKKKEESPPVSDEEFPFGRGHADSYFNDGYNDVPLSKKAKVSKRKRQKDKAPETTRRTSSFVMKLFDRSVDMTQFIESAPLYAVCRAWIKNNPSATLLKGDGNSWEAGSNRIAASREDSPDVDVTGKSENVYHLPPPVKDPTTGHLTLGPPRQIVSVEDLDNTLSTEADPLSLPSAGLLLQEHMDRWKLTRRYCKEEFRRSLQPYEGNFAVILSTCKDMNNDNGGVVASSGSHTAGPL